MKLQHKKYLASIKEYLIYIIILSISVLHTFDVKALIISNNIPLNFSYGSFIPGNLSSQFNYPYYYPSLINNLSSYSSRFSSSGEATLFSLQSEYNLSPITNNAYNSIILNRVPSSNFSYLYPVNIPSIPYSRELIIIYRVLWDVLGMGIWAWYNMGQISSPEPL